MALPDIATAPDFESLRRCVLRERVPERVHFIELHQDDRSKAALRERLGIPHPESPSDSVQCMAADTALQAALGYDVVRVHAPESEFRVDLTLDGPAVEHRRTSEGYVVHEHAGPIQTWEHLERYPWPDVSRIDPRPFEWCERHLPEGMRAYDLAVQVFEATTWLMGYESLFMKIVLEPDLVDALIERIGKCALDYVRFLCQFESVGVIWGTDDMGMRSSTMVAPDWLCAKILPWHREAAALAHSHGKLYFLHSCGKVDALMDSLIDDVGIDAKHSFEDAVTPVTEAHARWGGRVGILGGIDLDFLARSDVDSVRRRVNETLDQCQPRGGYVLGSGNSIASYVPIENYLTLLDAGRRWGRGC